MKATYESLADAADAAQRHHNGRYSDNDDGPNWALGLTFPEALELARKGWRDQLDATLAIAESAVAMADREHMMDTFQPVWDVSGAEVDVARYLSGEPECMIDFPSTKTSKAGRVITLVINFSVSAAVSGDAVLKRGQVIVALAMALERLGHAVEMWFVNHTAHHDRQHSTCTYKIKVKGVDDEIDPAQIMFAYAHPAMLRRLIFGIRESKCSILQHLPSDMKVSEFPDGTIVMPHLRSDRDVPDADEFLRKYLSELGLLSK